MAKQILSQRKALIFSFILFLLGVAVLTYVRNFWPAIALVLGIPLALKQYLTGKHYDMAMTLFVFIGIFVTVQFDISWHILLPILFTFGGIYVFCKEFFNLKSITEIDDEQDLNKEIEEDQEKKK
jgi:predicted membrane protein